MTKRTRKGKTFHFTSPYGENIKVDNLKAFCEKYHLSYDSMLSVHQGKLSHWYGWTKKLYPNNKPLNQLIGLRQSFEAPDIKSNSSNTTNTEDKKKSKVNKKDYSKDYPSNYIHSPHQDGVIEGRAKTYKFISPAGEQVSIYNLYRFCRDNQLKQGAMSLVASGKRNHHKGWTKYQA